MKNRSLLYCLIISSFFVVILSCNSGSESKSDAVAYNDSIVSLQEDIIRHFLDLGAKFETFDSATIHASYSDLRSIVNASIEKISGFDDFEGESYFKDATGQLFSFYNDVLEKEYRVILDVLTKGAEFITDYDTTVLDSLAAVVASKEAIQDTKFRKAQERFASQFNLLIMENKLQEDINNLSE